MSVIALLDPLYQAQLQDLLIIMPSTVYMKTLALTEVVTMDKFGPNATIASGILAKIWNVDILVARDRPMAEADGKVSATASNNTK